MKKAVLHTTTPMHCKMSQVLRDLLVLTKEMAHDVTFNARATKVNLKNFKTYL